MLVQQASAATLRDVRVWNSPERTRVVFDLDSETSHTLLSLENPDRLVVDVEKLSVSKKLPGLDFRGSRIKAMRHAARNKVDRRFVFDLRQPVRAKSFFLEKTADLPDRLVVDFYDKNAENRVTKTVLPAHQRDVIIAIDAGHGGEDPGAIGPGRAYEKVVVLSIARQLESILKNVQGYKPVMVRTGDYYVGLAKRRDIARAAQADLLVSIHADAFTDPRANGSSVYALSLSGATSASARFLAERENRSDLVGGVIISDKDDFLAEMLTDLSMTASLDASIGMGKLVLKEMGKISRLHKRDVEQAGFAVLKSPDVPSILVETGFISNPREARYLQQKGYQRDMAKAIFAGIDAHFRNSPPPDTWFAALKRGDAMDAPGKVQPKMAPGKVHKVASGDTLYGLARKYSVTVAAIRSHNHLKSDSLRVGQKLSIPANN